MTAQYACYVRPERTVLGGISVQELLLHALIYLSCHLRRCSGFPEEVVRSRDDLRLLLFPTSGIRRRVREPPSELLRHVELALLDLALEADDVDLEQVDAMADFFLKKGRSGSLIFYNNICSN